MKSLRITFLQIINTLKNSFVLCWRINTLCIIEGCQSVNNSRYDLYLWRSLYLFFTLKILSLDYDAASSCTWRHRVCLRSCLLPLTMLRWRICLFSCYTCLRRGRKKHDLCKQHDRLMSWTIAIHGRIILCLTLGQKWN